MFALPPGFSPLFVNLPPHTSGSFALSYGSLFSPQIIPSTKANDPPPHHLRHCGVTLVPLLSAQAPYHPRPYGPVAGGYSPINDVLSLNLTIAADVLSFYDPGLLLQPTLPVIVLTASSLLN